MNELLIFFKKLLPRIKNASFLSAGQLLSQLIGLAGIPLIARKLGAENYGIYATVIAYVGLFTLFNLQGVTKVLVREGSKDTNNLIDSIESIIGLKFLLTAFSMVATIVVALFIKSYDKKVVFYISIYSITHFVLSFRGILGAIYQATEKMKYIAYFSVANRLLYIISGVITVYIGGGVLGLIVVSVISNLITLIINFYQSRKLLKFNVFSQVVLKKKYSNQLYSFQLLVYWGIYKQKLIL